MSQTENQAKVIIYFKSIEEAARWARAHYRLLVPDPSVLKIEVPEIIETVITE